jgi:hypothetical protein
VIEMPPYSVQPALPQADLPSAQLSEADYAIFQSICVNADANRISQALTVPEYLEAWICIPGAAPGSFTLASPEENGYRLEHCSVDRSCFSITGSFLFCHLRKIRLLWRKTSKAFSSNSVVDFRLRGNFGSSIVELRHTELGSAQEHAWYQAMWTRSLEKFALLFGG